MFRFLAGTLFLLIPFYLSATSSTDSILNIVKSKPDTAKLSVLYEYGVNLTKQGETDEAIKIFTEALTIAKKINNIEKLPSIIKFIGNCYLTKGDSKTAIIQYEKSFQLAKETNNKYEIIQTKNNLGLAYRNLGNYDKSIIALFDAIKVADETKDTLMLAKINTNIAGVFFYQDNYTEALKYYKIADEIYQQIKNKEGSSGVKSNISTIYLDKKEFKKAIENFKEVYLYFESVKQYRVMAVIANNISRAYIGMKRYTEALKYLNLAVINSKKSNNQSSLANSNYLMGDIYVLLKKYSDALIHYNKSIELAQKLGLKPLMRDVYLKIAETEAQLNNYKNAYKYYRLYSKYQDTLVNENTNKQITEIQEKYESEKKERAIEMLNKEKKIQEAEIGKKEAELNTQKNIRNIGFVAIILLLSSLYLVHRNYKMKQKTALLLEEKNKEIESKNKDITDSIHYASRIQAAILPKKSSFQQFFSESFVLYLPKDIVAGDFYWLEKKENKILFAACDCTGHGVPGAMVSVVCVNGLNRSVREYNLTEPGAILNKTREIVIQEFEKSNEEVKDGMDISLCSMDFLTNTLTWAGANNPILILKKETKYLEEIAPNKQPIGKYDNPKPFTNHTVQLQKGDSIYIFTDGYQDQFGEKTNKKFMIRKLKDLFLQISSLPMNEQEKILFQEFNKWKGKNEQIDDVCVIGVRI